MMVRSKARMYGAIAAMVYMTCILFLASAEAGQGYSWTGDVNTPYTPKHTPGTGLGGCNKDKTFCWKIDVGTPNHNPPIGHPLKVYGHQAKNLIGSGEILHADMTVYGRFFLDVWSEYYGRNFSCEVVVDRRTYSCVERW